MLINTVKPKSESTISKSEKQERSDRGKERKYIPSYIFIRSHGKFIR